jgi:ATP-dependent exoDNAse (exonuclease V) alpha subunit
MKVVFVKNDPYSNGNRWYNGTVGYIKEIKGNEKTRTADSVLVKIDKTEDEYHEVFPVIEDIYSPYTKDRIGTITQFPFISAFSMTIDKSQGLTLDKVYLMLDSRMRDNQLYVALSRARYLNNVILNREIRREDITISANAQSFYNRIKGRLIPVFYEKEVNIINNITCNLNVNIQKNIIRNIA